MVNLQNMTRFNYVTPKELPDLKSETLPNGTRHYVTPEGVKLPSVTTVVGAQKKQAILEWRKRVGEVEANKISRQATSRGTNVHTICENYLNNKPDFLRGIMPDAVEMFHSLKPHLNKINNIHYQEQALWSHQLGLAGRVDCIAEYEGELSVIDFKTSKRPKTVQQVEDYWWQTAAYGIMYEELVGKPIHNLVILMAVQDDMPIVMKQKTEDHICGLVKAIQYYKNNK